MLQPKRTKFRKFQKGSFEGKVSNTKDLQHGNFALRSLTSGRLSARVIEAARRSMTRALKRHGQIWIRIFPDQNVSERGQGSVVRWMRQDFAGSIERRQQKNGLGTRLRGPLSGDESLRGHGIARVSANVG